MLESTVPNPHYLLNLIGALATGVCDELRDVLEAEVGIAGAASAALLAIDTWPDRSIHFLTDVLDLTHSGTVRVVDGLVTTGLIRRDPGSDRRMRSLHLTPSGQERVARLREARRRVLDGLLADVTPSERRTLLRIVQRSLRARSRTRADARHACRLCDHSVCRDEACPIGSSVHED
jgi:DNA-binding MarR family transcriptional regulator